MKTSEVHYKGELRTDAIHLKSGEKIVTDAPVDNQGKGEAFSPTDLTATSLAACMITTIGIMAQNKNIEIEKMDAEVLKVMAANPRRISEIHVDLAVKVSPDNSVIRNLVMDTAINCPVANSLHPDIKQEVNFSFL